MSKTLGYTNPNAARGGTLRLTFDAVLRRAFRDYAVEITAPEMNAADAWVAQVIRLVSRDGLSLVVGSIDQMQKSAELISLGYALARSKQRYGVEFKIPPAEYARFLDTAKQVLTEFELSVQVVTQPLADVERTTSSRGER